MALNKLKIDEIKIIENAIKFLKEKDPLYNN